MSKDNAGSNQDEARNVMAEIDRLVTKIAEQNSAAGGTLTSGVRPVVTTAAQGPATASGSETANAASTVQTNVASILAPILQSSSSLLREGLAATGVSGSGGGGWLSGLLSPLLGGIVRLFGRGADAPTASPIPYLRPAGVALDYGFSERGSGTLQSADYDLSGRPRIADTEARSSPAPITIQVQALDSRSILDHSREIADAVRQALLESHPLNDTLNEE
jgi:hypothetical protein